MKLIVAIVHDDDKHVLESEFRKNKIPSTRLSSTGSFLRSGNTTFLIGIEESRVDEVLEVIKKICEARDEVITAPINLDVNLEMSTAYPVTVHVGGATVFILPIEKMYRF